MTYLTQSMLSHATVAKLRFRDNYDWHQAIWKAFPGQDGAQRDFLTRLDTTPTGFRLLIVSTVEPTRPSWFPPDDEEGSWATKPVTEAYFRCRRYAFQLVANPTRKIDKLAPDGKPTKNGRRVPLRTREELEAWISRKGTMGGFSIDSESLQIFPRGRSYFEKKDHRGLHSAVEFQGQLTVTDTERFLETFEKGIGSAKAFGFGLLAIVPVS